VSSSFSEWRLLGRSRSDAARATPINTSAAGLVELFLKGRNRRDVDDEVIDELGYRISVWNGNSDEYVSSLTMKCGLYSTVDGLSNAVVLKLPPRFESMPMNRVRLIVLALVQSWDPDWAIVASRSRLEAEAEGMPFLDRALYVKSSMNIPEGCSQKAVRQELGGGNLFLAVDGSPEHVG
jgi:hypothetical protein